jgi:hypothetical protein
VYALPLGSDAFNTGNGEPYNATPTAIAAQTRLIMGQPGGARLVTNCSGLTVDIPFEPGFNTPAFRRYLLQAYPSGGCDLFVDGRHVTRSRPPGPQAWPDSVRIAAGGRTYRTDLLIGEFRVWQGIVAPPDTASGRRPL